MTDNRTKLGWKLLREERQCRREGRPNNEAAEQLVKVVENEFNMPYKDILARVGVITPAKWERDEADTRPGKWMNRFFKGPAGPDRTR